MTNATDHAAMHQLSIRQWESERLQRLDALAAALASLNATSKHLGGMIAPTGDHMTVQDARDHISAARRAIRQNIAATVRQPNPFTGAEL